MNAANGIPVRRHVRLGQSRAGFAEPKGGGKCYPHIYLADLQSGLYWFAEALLDRCDNNGLIGVTAISVMTSGLAVHSLG